MRIVLMVFLVLLLSNFVCDMGSTKPGSTYDTLLFERHGGGDKAFAVTPARTQGTVSISVTRYGFRDTLVQFDCAQGAATADAFAALLSALRGTVPIAGDFHQSPLPTGTWVHLYVVRDKEQIEITNTELRNRLLPFEPLVESRMPTAP